MLRGSIASIVRLFYLDAITVTNNEYFKSTSKLAVWSTIEPGIGIMAASVATLRRLFQHIFKSPGLFGYLSRRNSQAPGTIACTTTIVQELTELEAPTKTRLASDATTLVALTGEGAGRKTSVAAKSMADEMRAYGMSDYDECANVMEQDLQNHDRYVKAENRKVHVYCEQRASGSTPRSSSSNTYRTSSLDQQREMFVEARESADGSRLGRVMEGAFF